MHTRREFYPLLRGVFEFMHGVYEDMGYDRAFDPVCDSMWANINPRGAYNRYPSHPHALWSGVYYVQTPENSALLSFNDPRPQAQVLTPYFDPERRRMESCNEVYYQPTDGPDGDRQG